MGYDLSRKYYLLDIITVLYNTHSMRSGVVNRIQKIKKRHFCINDNGKAMMSTNTYLIYLIILMNIELIKFLVYLFLI